MPLCNTASVARGASKDTRPRGFVRRRKHIVPVSVALVNVIPLLPFSAVSAGREFPFKGFPVEMPVQEESPDI